MSNRDRPILLVDDNEDDVFFMERALKEAGLGAPLRRLGSGQETIDYLAGTGAWADRVEHPLPLLVLLDLKLPYHDGLEVLRWIRTRPDLATLIVIVLTSSAHPRDVATAYALGARAYLVKPHTPEELQRMVAALKAFWFEHNEFPPVAAAKPVSPVP